MATFSYCRKQRTHFFGNFCLFYLLFSSPFFSFPPVFFLLISFDFFFFFLEYPVLFFQCTILCNLWIFSIFLPFFLSFLFKTLAILFTNLENDLLTCRLFFFFFLRRKGLLVQVPFPPPPLFVVLVKCVWLKTAVHYKHFYSLNSRAIQKVPGMLHRG